ncbi:excinuclease ABC subunit UvrC [Coraliomargarita sp. SDUM461004]|uniref:Excinuclease ABC subunit UvrC n=1 Tax=Thalassobacterium sedimentorum TaxID=3041258 RepID=A0ABU1AEJ0_9BACT|nr:excinuclease ABC subunit UvrC [Coraliomargarita sp. SDUM461004]MDQ8193196.1 excinuclease ABC subunit UvrC [Coraliomargarita sp. SDUM461004]
MSEGSKAQLKEKVRRLPHKPGVYQMKDRIGQIIYVGKAKDLKKRVSTYFQASRKMMVAQPKVRAMLDLIHDFEIIIVKSEAEALLLEGQLIKKYKPRYNTDFTDDKRFLLVRIDPRENLPRFRLTRNRTDSNSRYYGPFAHSSHLRKTLAELRRRFGILLSDASPIQLADGRWRLYDDARAEIYEHANEITTEEYAERMEAACEFLDGKARQWLAELKAEMIAAAEARRYEEAAALRDRIEALERTTDRTRKFERNLVGTHNHSQVVKRLQAKLGIAREPSRMECFDISHISGSFCVASMVAFKDGHPDRKNYRRFKIKSFVGNDDFRAMEEVVGRRYRRLHDEGKAFPDLIVIDGGAGQVTAALKAFLSQGLEPPELIGLAKRNETVIFSDGREPLNIPHHDPALRLLQHIRDEAHHFANSFNAELRSKRLRESILDDFKGLGSQRKQQLLRHFGSLEKLRAAEVDQLTQVEGIGKLTAERLVEFFRA